MAVQALFGLNGAPAVVPTDGAGDGRADAMGDAGAFQATLAAAQQGSGPASGPKPIVADSDADAPTAEAAPDGTAMALLALLFTAPASPSDPAVTNAVNDGPASTAPVAGVAPAQAGATSVPGLATTG